MLPIVAKIVGSALLKRGIISIATIGIGSCVYFKIKNIGRQEVVKEIHKTLKKAQKKPVEIEKDFKIKNKKRAAKQTVKDAAQKAKNLMDDVSR